MNCLPYVCFPFRPVLYWPLLSLILRQTQRQLFDRWPLRLFYAVAGVFFRRFALTIASFLSWFFCAFLTPFR